MSQIDGNVMQAPKAGGAPPTRPGALLRGPRPPVWPGIVGTISIVLAGIGLLQYGINTVIAPVAAYFMSRASFPSGQPGPDFASQMEAVEPYQWIGMAGNAFGLGLSILLLCSGIALFRRRPFGARGHRLWAMLKFGHAVYATAVGFLVMSAQFGAMENDPRMQQLPIIGGGFFRVMGLIGLGMMLVFYCAYPVFVLVWFNRARVRAETAGWQRQD